MFRRLSVFIKRTIYRQGTNNVQPEEPVNYNVQRSMATERERHEEVLRFIKPCYIAAGLFFTVTVWQWMVLSHLVPPSGYFMIAGCVCLTIAFAVLLILNICVHFRRNYIFSCVMGWLFVETAGMGMVLIMPERSLLHVCIAVAMALLVLFICYVIGAWVPKVALPGEITMCICLIIFIVMNITLLTLFIITDNVKYKTLYFGLMGIFTIPTSIYNAQIIHGRRFYVPFEEHVNLAVSVYLNFLMFFASIYYGLWVHQW